MTYQPNLNDPRVINRCKRALGFCLAVMSPDKPHQWSSRWIDKWLGRSDTDISIWLRHHLLIVHDDKWVIGSQCKSYLLNKRGSEYIHSVVMGNKQPYHLWKPEDKPNHQSHKKLIIDWVNASEWRVELATGDFAYRDIKNRLWHPIQNIRNEYRGEVMESWGYKYNYDISCSSAQLIVSHALELGMDSELALPIQDYIANKEYHRTRLADLLGCTTKTIKVIINSLFCGARLGVNPNFSLSVLLSHNKSAIDKLKNDKWLSQLRDSIRWCWRQIEPHYMMKYSRSGRKIAMSSKQKWAVYFQLERQVLDVIRLFLMTSANQCFLEHDGWRCKSPVNITELNQYVSDNLGFTINID